MTTDTLEILVEAYLLKRFPPIVQVKSKVTTEHLVFYCSVKDGTKEAPPLMSLSYEADSRLWRGETLYGKLYTWTSYKYEEVVAELVRAWTQRAVRDYRDCIDTDQLFQAYAEVQHTDPEELKDVLLREGLIHHGVSLVQILSLFETPRIAVEPAPYQKPKPKATKSREERLEVEVQRLRVVIDKLKEELRNTVKADPETERQLRLYKLRNRRQLQFIEELKERRNALQKEVNQTKRELERTERIKAPMFRLEPPKTST